MGIEYRLMKEKLSINVQRDKMREKKNQTSQKSFWLYYVWFRNLNISPWITRNKSFKYETDVIRPVLL